MSATTAKTTTTSTTGTAAPPVAPHGGGAAGRGRRIGVTAAVLVALVLLGVLAALLYLALRPKPPPDVPIPMCTSKTFEGFQLFGNNPGGPAQTASDAECAARCGYYAGPDVWGWNRDQNSGQCYCVGPPLATPVSGRANPAYNTGFFATLPPLTGGVDRCGMTLLSAQHLFNDNGENTVTPNDFACAKECANHLAWTRQQSTQRCYCIDNGSWSATSMEPDADWDSGSTQSVPVSPDAAFGRAGGGPHRI